MSPQNPSLIVGLAAPGLLWLATSVALGQASPPPQGPSPAPTIAALLLSNGQVVRGEIVEDVAAGEYHLQTSGGPVPFSRSRVAKAAGSVEELYRFRVARLPAGDPDERIRLARWCLAEHLPAQAKEQLLAVRAMCPGDVEVEKMLKNLAFNQEQPGTVDADLRRTSGEAPASLDPRVVVHVRRNNNALPVIFDLPPVQAVKRAGEFTEHIQPILMQSCARCHNERYQGSFQLVEFNPRDRRNPDITRANLDATLRLVNPDDPSRSDLLSAGLVPHGPNRNAIFTGPNDRNYRDLATWTKSLRPAAASPARPPSDPVTRTGFDPTAQPAGDGFASDRVPGAAPTPGPAPSPLPGMDVLAAGRAAAPPPPSRRIENKFEESADFSGDPNAQFQAPYSAGGPPPPGMATRPPGPARGVARPPASPANVAPASPSSVVVDPTDNPNQLPGMDKPLYPTSPGADSPARKNKAKIDPALLEKMMRNRNTQP